MTANEIGNVTAKSILFQMPLDPQMKKICGQFNKYFGRVTVAEAILIE